MNREQKSAVIEEIAGEINEAEAIFAIDYRGISVPQAAELRGKLRQVDASFRVVKNSLTERAADQAGADALRPMLQGPTALTFVRGDAALAAKALADFARSSQLLEFKGGVLDGDTLSADQVRAIARLPSRDVLHAQLVGMVASPLTGLVRTLNALISGIAVQLGQIRDQGLVGGDAPATVEAEAAPEAETAPEPEAETAPEPEAETAPEPEAETAPEPEAETAPDPGTEAGPTPDSTASETPQED